MRELHFRVLHLHNINTLENNSIQKLNVTIYSGKYNAIVKDGPLVSPLDHGSEMTRQRCPDYFCHSNQDPTKWSLFPQI